MSNRILVERLYELYDPLYPLVGDAITMEELAQQVVVCRTKYKHWDYNKRTLAYDVSRISQFMDKFLRGGKVDPISIDCYGGTISTNICLNDGHHRFLGAIFAGAKYIQANFGGRLDVLRYLQGRRKAMPKE